MNVLGKPSKASAYGFVTVASYDRLKDENDKLKKLMKTAIRQIREMCSTIPNDECCTCPMYYDNGCCHMAITIWEAKELGIKVND